MQRFGQLVQPWHVNVTADDEPFIKPSSWSAAINETRRELKADLKERGWNLKGAIPRRSPGLRWKSNGRETSKGNNWSLELLVRN